MSGNVIGDVWNVRKNDTNYAWTSEGWDALGGTAELASLTANGLISKEDFANVIKNVNVSFRNGNLNVSVNPKDEDAVSGDDKKKFDDLCNKFFEQAVSEYFAEN